MEYIVEPERRIPIIQDADVCVIGGGTAGVFAAVRAARLGASVVIVEKQNAFGGTSTSGMVSVWHYLTDDRYEQQIIGGLTADVLDRLDRRDAVIHQDPDPQLAYRMKNIPQHILNNDELKIELDELLAESGATVRLHTVFVDAQVSDGQIEGVVVQDASGRRAIRAKVFIDATGDGAVLRSVGIPYESLPDRQPATTGAKVSGVRAVSTRKFYEILLEHREEFDLPHLGFSVPVPNCESVEMLLESNVFFRAEVAEELTAAEIEGRRQNRAMLDILRKHAPNGRSIALLDLASHIGIRETIHAHCLYRLTGQDVLDGRTFDDGIANSAYPVDIHHYDRPGATYRFLDGTEEYDISGKPRQITRWRTATADTPTYYQIPYRSLVPVSVQNLLVCGRHVDADKDAFGAIRVQISTNQTGEAAGVAAVIALDNENRVGLIDSERLRSTLSAGGSIVL